MGNPQKQYDKPSLRNGSFQTVLSPKTKRMCEKFLTSMLGYIGPISCAGALRCGVRERMRVRSRWVQRFSARTHSRLLRPDDGPLDEREQHAGPQVHAGRCRAEWTAVCCGRL